jgi:hypothetical protein
MFSEFPDLDLCNQFWKPSGSVEDLLFLRPVAAAGSWNRCSQMENPARKHPSGVPVMCLIFDAVTLPDS